MRNKINNLRPQRFWPAGRGAVWWRRSDLAPARALHHAVNPQAERESTMNHVTLQLCRAAAVAVALVGIVALAPAPAHAQGRPDLQPGDSLVIVIPEREEADVIETTIDEYGEVALGVYGRVELGGLDEDAALDALRDHLSTYLRSTIGVRLTVQERGVLVFVTGQVASPGRYSVPRGSDAWTAIRTAGGELDTADLTSVVVQHGEREQEFDVAAFLTRRRSEPLPALRAGDLVFVPADPSLGATESGAGRVLDDEALAGRVFVLGAVNAPGAYDRTPDLTPIGALAAAAGPMESAEISNARLITSGGSVRVDLAALMLGEPNPAAVFPEGGGAILYVPHDADDAVDPFTDGINVIGEFNGPRHLETPEPLPLFEVMSLAGGPATDADIRRVYHVRQDNGFTIALHYDMRRFVRHGGLLGTVMVHPGDVLYLRPDPENAWEILVGGISDVAVIGTAVLLAVTLNESLGSGGE